MGRRKFGHVQQSLIIRSRSENLTDIAEMILCCNTSRFFTKGCSVSEKMELNKVGRRRFGYVQQSVLSRQTLTSNRH